MKTPVTLIHALDPAPAIEVLREAHPDLTILGCDSYAGLAGMIAEHAVEAVYSVRFDGGTPFPREALFEAPSVKLVSVGGSGIDHLGQWDTGAVTVCNSAGVAADMMAEYVLGAALSFTLDLARYRRDQAARVWDPAAKVEPLEGKTALVVGLGKTGHAVVRRLSAMGMKVIGVRARPAPVEGCAEVHGMDALPALWPRADLITICVPLLESTRGLVGPAAFAAMKPSAIFTDVSRGGVVDEPALLAALQEGRIRGAARDVYATEPLPAESAFWGCENLILTPHSSAVYDGWEIKSVRMFAENLWRYRRGEALSNVVDPVRGY